MGWGIEAKDVWLHLMTALRRPPFLGGTTGPSAARSSMRATAGSLDCAILSTNASTAEVGIRPPSAHEARDRLLKPSPLGNTRTPVNVSTMEPWLISYPNWKMRLSCILFFLSGFFILLCLSWSRVFDDNLHLASDYPQVFT